jgi:hypothetical protein
MTSSLKWCFPSICGVAFLTNIFAKSLYYLNWHRQWLLLRKHYLIYWLYGLVQYLSLSFKQVSEKICHNLQLIRIHYWPRTPFWISYHQLSLFFLSTFIHKVQKDKQRSTKHTYKTKDWVTLTPLKTVWTIKSMAKLMSSLSS